MATQTQVRKFRQALDNLASKGRSDFRDIWRKVESADFSAQREALNDAFPALIAKYGEMSAKVGGDMVDEWLKGKADIKIVRPVDDDQAAARMRWALGTPEAVGNLDGIVDELVKQPARSTVISSAQKSKVGFARVPSGSDACAFCTELASRGADYTSEFKASVRQDEEGRYRKFHDYCRCTVVAVESDDDLPGDYDPKALYDKYERARDAIGSRGATEDNKSILSEMRKQQGTH